MKTVNMPKKRELSNDVKEMIVTLNLGGLSKNKIGELLGIHRSTVGRVLKKFQERGSVENNRRSGRPRVTDARGDRKIYRIVKRNRRQSLQDITSKFNGDEGTRMSKRTIRRRLHQEGYRRGKIQKTLTICKVNRQRRILWCRGKRHWKPEQWQKVIFSDETQVVIGQNNSVSLWRKSSEKWKPYCLNQRKTASKVSCMFWGCITYDGIGVLVPVDGNLNSTKYIELLDNSLWPVIVKAFGNRPFIFQNDNATPHSSRRTNNWKTENGIPKFNWPAQSPDLNIIENIWRCIKIKLSREIDTIENRSDLVNAVTRIWNGLSQTYIRSLYASIPARIRQVMIQKEYATKY